MSTTQPTADAEVNSPDVAAWKREIVVEARERADEVLDAIEGDHRFCANCYKQIRTIMPRELRARDGDPPACVVDLAFPTEHSHTALGDRMELRESPGSLDAPPGHDDAERGREWHTAGLRVKIICNCGMGHHRTSIKRPVKAHLGKRYVRQLSDTIHQLREEAESGGKDEYERVDEWDHDRSSLVRNYESLKSDDDRQDEDLIRRALIQTFVSQALATGG